mmetsp:Transcript_45716/g.148616  ORF Transcript_45716/g.148616 Transcript_45716/m.148616 type:complete len:210 (-) Transcript_45716:10-639(-)
MRVGGRVARQLIRRRLKVAGQLRQLSQARVEGRAERKVRERRRLVANVCGELRVHIEHLPNRKVARARPLAAEEQRLCLLQAGLVLGKGLRRCEQLLHRCLEYLARRTWRRRQQVFKVGAVDHVISRVHVERQQRVAPKLGHCVIRVEPEALLQVHQAHVALAHDGAAVVDFEIRQVRERVDLLQRRLLALEPRCVIGLLVINDVMINA